MKANEFVKKFGWDEARKQIKKPTGIHGAAFDYQFMDELKRLVESYELVESYGGLESAKEFMGSEYRKLSQPKTYNRLCEAIEDVESCK